MEQQVLNDPKINEALELLNNSAKEKKDQLQQLIGDRYSNLRDAVSNVSGEATRTVQRSPWFFLGGVAIASLIIGYFAGRSRD